MGLKSLALSVLAGTQSVPRGVPQGHTEGTPGGAYSARLAAALRSICNPSYPAGLIPWLGEYRLDLYNLLVNGIPDKLHRLWEAHGPIEEFEASLATWREAHVEAVKEFKLKH